MSNTQEEQKAQKQFRVTEVKIDAKNKITYTVRLELLIEKNGKTYTLNLEFLIFTLQLKDEWNFESLKEGDSILLPEEIYNGKKAGDKIIVDKKSFFILFHT
jgi:hypothetical protein